MKQIQRQRDVQTDRDQHVPCCRTMKGMGLERLQLSHIPKKKKKNAVDGNSGVGGSIWHMDPKVALKIYTAHRPPSDT